MKPGAGERWKTRLQLACLVIVAAGLFIELLVRPFWPEIVKTESRIEEIARMLIGLFAGGYGI